MLLGMNLITHKRAHFDFEILETVEAGIVLSGFEVKAVRAHQGKLEGAHVVVRGGEAFLVGATITPLQPKNVPKNYESDHTRTLLLSKEQIQDLGQKSDARGLTIVPLSMYNKGRLLKLSIGVARGKKKGDKREAIKKRDTLRDIKRELARQ
jgi:SsrA-binding protein